MVLIAHTPCGIEGHQYAIFDEQFPHPKNNQCRQEMGFKMFCLLQPVPKANKEGFLKHITSSVNFIIKPISRHFRKVVLYILSWRHICCVMAAPGSGRQNPLYSCLQTHMQYLLTTRFGNVSDFGCPVSYTNFYHSKFSIQSSKRGTVDIDLATISFAHLC